MTSFRAKFQDPYKSDVIPVVLTAVDDTIQYDSNREPNFVRIRSGNLGYLYLDSATADGPPNKFIVGGKQLLFQNKIKRFALSTLRIGYNIPNVNPYNNSGTIFIDNGSSTLFYTFTVPTGYYTTSTQFANALATAINAAISGSGATMTITPLTTDPETYTMTLTAGFTFRFDLQSKMVKYGRFLCNLPTSQILSNSKTMGAVQLIYTRYIDITSFALNQYNKNMNSSGITSLPQLLIRLYETPFSQDQNGTFIAYSRDRFITLTNLNWTNFERDVALTACDITLYDEFGNLLYIPENLDRPTDFYISLELVTEL